jgi:hypothetical protein
VLVALFVVRGRDLAEAPALDAQAVPEPA